MKKLLTLTIAAFMGAISMNAQTLPNAGFENWQSYTVITAPTTPFERPTGWFGSDSLLFFAKVLMGNPPIQKQLLKSSTEKHSGTYSVELTTKDQDTFGVLPGVLANASIKVDILNFDPNDPLSSFSYEGGTAINQRVSAVSAWVKYNQQNNDQGQLIAQAVLAGAGTGGSDSVVGTGTATISSSATFTQVSANITYNDPNVVPDKLLVIVLSSIMSSSNTPQAETVLWVDDMTVSGPNGIEEFLLGNNAVSAYPNPANDVVNFKTDVSGQLTLAVYDLSGKLQYQTSFENAHSLQTSGWAAGTYIFNARNSDGALVGSGRITKQ